MKDKHSLHTYVFLFKFYVSLMPQKKSVMRSFDISSEYRLWHEMLQNGKCEKMTQNTKKAFRECFVLFHDKCITDFMKTTSGA